MGSAAPVCGTSRKPKGASAVTSRTYSARCPSKWGAGDERGAGNHMKPQSVLNATKLIKTGEVIELGHVLNAAMPLSPGRMFNMQTKRTGIGALANKLNGNEELIVADMGQVGTQFDGFAHITHNNVHYNCPLPIHVSATSPQGIFRITLKIDGRLIRNYGGSTYPSRLSGFLEWQGAKHISAGRHTLTFLAYDQERNVSEQSITIFHGRKGGTSGRVKGHSKPKHKRRRRRRH